jgi:transcriptional regulator with XRE-family HTH domain
MTPAALLAWRKRLGLSQAEAARILGCGHRTYQRWEAGPAFVPRCIELACAAVEAGLCGSVADLMAEWDQGR